jgi:3-deoxy-7-phosphoheptulonate synthase/chorismate mutase
MSNDKLAQLRGELDQVNLKILELINQRATLVQEIGKVKSKQGINRFDPEREREMLNLIVENNKGPFEDSAIRHLFKQIFSASLDLQKDDNKKVLLVSRKKKQEPHLLQAFGRNYEKSFKNFFNRRR